MANTTKKQPTEKKTAKAKSVSETETESVAGQVSEQAETPIAEPISEQAAAFGETIETPTEIRTEPAEAAASASETESEVQTENVGVTEPEQESKSAKKKRVRKTREEEESERAAQKEAEEDDVSEQEADEGARRDPERDFATGAVEEDDGRAHVFVPHKREETGPWKDEFGYSVMGAPKASKKNRKKVKKHKHRHNRSVGGKLKIETIDGRSNFRVKIDGKRFAWKKNALPAGEHEVKITTYFSFKQWYVWFLILWDFVSAMIGRGNFGDTFRDEGFLDYSCTFRYERAKGAHDLTIWFGRDVMLEGDGKSDPTDKNVRTREGLHRALDNYGAIASAALLTPVAIAVALLMIFLL